MIVDNLMNCNLYITIDNRFANVFRFLNENDLCNLEVGKHSIMEDDVFAIVSEYETKDKNEAFWEAHKKYIDIQCLAKGEEQIGILPVEKLDITQAYDNSNDVVLGKAEGKYITLNTGSFVIFYPNDAHKPGIMIDEKAIVKKIVVKVKI